MRDERANLNEYHRKLSDLQRGNLEQSAKALGFDLGQYERDAKQRLAALQELLLPSTISPAR